MATPAQQDPQTLIQAAITTWSQVDCQSHIGGKVDSLLCAAILGCSVSLMIRWTLSL